MRQRSRGVALARFEGVDPIGRSTTHGLATRGWTTHGPLLDQVHWDQLEVLFLGMTRVPEGQTEGRRKAAA